MRNQFRVRDLYGDGLCVRTGVDGDCRLIVVNRCHFYRHCFIYLPERRTQMWLSTIGFRCRLDLERRCEIKLGNYLARLGLRLFWQQLNVRWCLMTKKKIINHQKPRRRKIQLYNSINWWH